MNRTRAGVALPLLAFACMILLLAAFAGKTWLGADAIANTAAQREERLDQLVFPQNDIVDVRVTLDSGSFQEMLDNAADEQFYPASVHYNGLRFDNIGIRTKGNLSLRSVINSDSDRYSFKLSFDEYISGQTIFGVGKINLNNNFSDATYMREYLAYELARQMGLPAPKTSYVRLYVNDELKGLYLAVEQIDDAYLERHFTSAGGTLYKAVQGTGTELKWLGDDPASYAGLVGKTKSADDTGLIAMLDELNNGDDYTSVLDVDNALRYIALNVAAVNWDSYLGSNKHNYYLYESNGRFSVLPWDFNMAFGGFGSSSQLLIDEPTQGAVADRPLAAKLLGVEAYKVQYHNILREAVEGYLAPNALEARVGELKALIAEEVKQDPTAFYTYEQFESGIAQLLNANKTVTTTIVQQLNGDLPSAGDGSGSGGGGPGGGFGGGGFGVGGGRDRAAPNGGGGQGMQQQLPPQLQPQRQGQRPIQAPNAANGALPTVSEGGVNPENAAAFRQLAAPGSPEGLGTANTDNREQLPGNRAGGAAGPNGQNGNGGQAPVPGQGFGGMNGDGAAGFGGNPNAGGPNAGGPGRGGGMPFWENGDPNGSRAAATAADSLKHLYTTAIMLLLLLAACLFVIYFRRKRW